MLAGEVQDRVGFGVARELDDLAAEVARELEELGELVVVTAQRLARRVHVDDPELALQAFGQAVAAAHELLGDRRRP